MRLLDEISDMLKHDEIDNNEALRIMLLTQAEILDRLDKLEQEIRDIHSLQRDYPSMMWMWQHRRRDVILLFFFLAFFYTALFAPVNFAEWRQDIIDAIMGWFGP